MNSTRGDRVQFALTFTPETAMPIILHLVSADYFGSMATDTPYLPQGFEVEGFIHYMYGPINRDAIVGIARVRCDTDGEFTGFDSTLDVWEVRK